MVSLHSKKVTYYKRFFGLIIFSILLYLALSLGFFTNQDRLKLVEANQVDEKAYNKGNQVIKPKLFGNSNNGLPYVIVAEQGFEPDKNKIKLFKVEADIDLGNNSNCKITAKEADGEYSSKQLLLSGNVKFDHSDGIKIETEKAIVNYAESKIIGDMPVEVTNEQMVLTAQKFRADTSKQIFHFIGDIKVTLKP